MSASTAVRITDSLPGVDNLADYLASFERRLRLRNRSPRTIQSYGEAARFFIQFLGERGMPLEGARIRREHVEAYVEHLQARHAEATVAVRYRSLQQFFNYLVDEGECAEHPMAKMDTPFVSKKLVDVIPDPEVGALLDACAGKGYQALRDTALTRLFLDTGVRVSEMAGLAVEDLTLKHNSALVYLGKGRKPRVVSYGDKTAEALERYLRARTKYLLRNGDDRSTRLAKARILDEDGDPRGSALWLGPKGALTVSGIAQLYRRLARRAGLRHIHPHRFRHTAAHNCAAAGMSETDMMRLFGWDSSEMPKLYGASAGSERAREAYKRLNVGGKY